MIIVVHINAKHFNMFLSKISIILAQIISFYQYSWVLATDTYSTNDAYLMCEVSHEGYWDDFEIFKILLIKYIPAR